MTTQAHEVKPYYAKHDGSADGQAMTALTVDAGSSASAIICDECTQADDALNDCVIEFLTGALAGEIGHVKDFVASTDTMELYRPLSGAPSAGDTFRVLPFGVAADGAYRSTLPIAGLQATAFTNINASGTAVTDAYIPASVGAGSAQVKYTQSADELAFKAPGDSIFGPPVDVSGGDGTYALYAAPDADGNSYRYCEVTLDYSELPVGDATDTLTLTLTSGMFLPNIEAPQVESGYTRYGIAIFKNLGSEALVNALALARPPVEASTAMAASWNGSDATLQVDDASGMPGQSFWLVNKTANSGAGDCAYIYSRDGNDLYPAPRTGTLRGLSAATWAVDDEVEVWSNIDIAEGTESSGQFDADLSALSYAAHTSVVDGIDIGTVAANGLVGIAIKQVILDVQQATNAIENEVSLYWE